MVASNQRLAEVHIVDLVQVSIRDDEKHAALNVLSIKGVADFQQCCVDLFTRHEVLVRHVGEFLEYLLHHANMLVKHVTDVSHCLADPFCLSTLVCLQGGTLIICWIWPGINPWLNLHHLTRAVFIEQCVTEFIVRDLAILALVEVTHENENFVIFKHEAELLQGLPELLQRDDAIVVSVKATEDIAHQWELLPHSLSFSSTACKSTVAPSPS